MSTPAASSTTQPQSAIQQSSSQGQQNNPYGPPSTGSSAPVFTEDVSALLHKSVESISTLQAKISDEFRFHLFLERQSKEDVTDVEVKVLYSQTCGFADPTHRGGYCISQGFALFRMFPVPSIPPSLQNTTSSSQPTSISNGSGPSSLSTGAIPAQASSTANTTGTTVTQMSNPNNTAATASQYPDDHVSQIERTNVEKQFERITETMKEQNLFPWFPGDPEPEPKPKKTTDGSNGDSPTDSNANEGENPSSQQNQETQRPSETTGNDESARQTMSSTIQDRLNKEQQKSKRTKKQASTPRWVKPDDQNTLKVSGLVTHALSDVDSKTVLEIYRVFFKSIHTAIRQSSYYKSISLKNNWKGRHAYKNFTAPWFKPHLSISTPKGTVCVPGHPQRIRAIPDAKHLRNNVGCNIAKAVLSAFYDNEKETRFVMRKVTLDIANILLPLHPGQIVVTPQMFIPQQPPQISKPRSQPASTTSVPQPPITNLNEQSAQPPSQPLSTNNSTQPSSQPLSTNNSTQPSSQPLSTNNSTQPSSQPLSTNNSSQPTSRSAAALFSQRLSGLTPADVPSKEQQQLEGTGLGSLDIIDQPIPNESPLPPQSLADELDSDNDSSNPLNTINAALSSCENLVNMPNSPRADKETITSTASHDKPSSPSSASLPISLNQSPMHPTLSVPKNTPTRPTNDSTQTNPDSNARAARQVDAEVDEEASGDSTLKLAPHKNIEADFVWKRPGPQRPSETSSKGVAQTRSSTITPSPSSPAESGQTLSTKSRVGSHNPISKDTRALEQPQLNTGNSPPEQSQSGKIKRPRKQQRTNKRVSPNGKLSTQQQRLIPRSTQAQNARRVSPRSSPSKQPHRESPSASPQAPSQQNSTEEGPRTNPQQQPKRVSPRSKPSQRQSEQTSNSDVAQQDHSNHSQHTPKIDASKHHVSPPRSQRNDLTSQSKPTRGRSEGHPRKLPVARTISKKTKQSKQLNVPNPATKPPSVLKREQAIKEKEERKKRLLHKTRRTSPRMQNKQDLQPSTTITSGSNATTNRIKPQTTRTSSNVETLPSKLTKSSSHHLSRRQVEKSKADAEKSRAEALPKVTFKKTTKEPKPVLRKPTTRSSATGTSSTGTKKTLRFKT